MVCPYGKTDCKHEPVYGNYDLSRQCWRYYNDECQNADKYDSSNSTKIEKEDI